MKSLFAFLAVLGLSLLIASAAIRPPAPVGADAPETAFSAGRAMADIHRIARAPHPTGSAENRHVRDYLVRRLEGLGLEVTIQRAEVLRARNPGWATGADVENIIATLPGEDRSAPVVLLMSHYDSAVGSPGAADDAAGVASSLEAVRALLADDRPRRRDLVILITDAEEQGLLGAQAFFEEHPLADRIGAIVNLETRGASGRAFMFQTGPDNGAMMGLYAREVSTPSTTSLAAFLYSILPNDTDFTHAVEAGMAGFNIAFIGEPFHYHSVTSTPATLDQASLQHMGAQTLDLTRALTYDAQLPEARPDAVFSDIFGLFTLAYPAWAGWVVLAVTALILAGLFLRGAQTGPRLRPIVAGAAAGLLITVVSAVLARLVLMGTGAVIDFVEGRPLLGRLGVFEAALFLAGLAAALVVGRLALKGWRGGADRDPAPVALGLVILGWLLAVALQALAPAAALLLAWPALFAALALLARRRLGEPGLWIAGGLSVLALAWVLGIADGIFQGVGATTPEAVGALALVVVLACAPLWASAVATRRTLALGLACLALSAGLTAYIRLAPQSSPERPRFTQVLFVSEPTTGQARIVGAMTDLDDWSRGVLTSSGGQPASGDEPALWLEDVHVASAQPIEATGVTTEPFTTPDGRAGLRLPLPSGVRELRLLLDGDGLADIAVQGQPMVAPDAGEPARIRWAAPGRQVEVVARAAGPVTLRWATLSDGWPADAPPLAPRTPDLAPWGASDSHVVVGEAALTPPG